MVLEQGIVKLYGCVTTTTSGTIGSSRVKGFTIVKTASKTGRYTVTLADKYTLLYNCTAQLIGSADVAYTATKGLVSIVRNNTIPTGQTFDIQFVDPDGSAADAEVENSVIFCLEITLKNSSAY